MVMYRGVEEETAHLGHHFDNESRGEKGEAKGEKGDPFLLSLLLSHSQFVDFFDSVRLSTWRSLSELSKIILSPSSTIFLNHSYPFTSNFGRNSISGSPFGNKMADVIPQLLFWRPIWLPPRPSAAKRTF